MLRKVHAIFMQIRSRRTLMAARSCVIRSRHIASSSARSDRCASLEGKSTSYKMINQWGTVRRRR